MDMEWLLEIKNVRKRFPGVLALDNVSFEVRKGEVHALVGENGAGKSTLIKIISGVNAADEGEMFFEGKKVAHIDPLGAIALGISTVHQELKMAESLSVAENIYLGHPPRKSTVMGKNINWKQMNRDANEFVRSLGIQLDVTQRVESLSVAQKQIVEICKALKREAKLIIMDEPSATLTENELKILFNIICHLKEIGISVIYISHRLEEIFEIADRVTVLRDGKTVTTNDVSEMDRVRLIKHIVGREINNIYPPRENTVGEKILEVRNLNRKGVLHNISFELHRGEILGIAGLVGSGRTELLRAIFGIDKIDSGEILIHGKPLHLPSIEKAIKHKMGFLPEERKVQGIIPDFSVAKNITLVGNRKILKNTMISPKIERDIAKRFIDRLRIMTPSEKQLISDLSGGNQQKCVLAKWLFVEPDIILFDEPTRGIDVGAKQEIYRILIELSRQGKAIVVVSSELPEVMGISHNIIVMHDGKITGRVKADEAAQEEIMAFATA